MQVEVVVVGICASVQGLPVKLPLPLLLNPTVPCGNDFVPAAVSETTTVQVVAGPLITTDAGVHPVTTVWVLRLSTVRPNVFELAECALEPP